MAHNVPRPRRRRRAAPPGISRQDSDDELGSDDLPWQWIYSTHSHDQAGSRRKRRRLAAQRQIVGARLGSFECRIGDCVLLKAEGSNEAWVAIICEFLSGSPDADADHDEKSANLMWFSTEQEIRNKLRKRSDFFPNELYISPSWDINPLASINGKARVMSPAAFFAKFPSGKVPRHHPDHGKVFVCRRGCNTRTATYTDEFVWDDIYTGGSDIDALIDRITRDTKASRSSRPKSPPDDAYAHQG
ncbi:hypothetical protein CDD82_6777 [Ophiocordyceps australis]|uniref:BAH domain-containing protein n=1 Tax=Ophiocordyceps australis TaxID=1399860 RepID=A0A2C5YUM8_9HYPO|nr:hypothetical protein CDD82_6777 [Ophiocordyceps australis]